MGDPEKPPTPPPPPALAVSRPPNNDEPKALHPGESSGKPTARPSAQRRPSRFRKSSTTSKPSGTLPLPATTTTSNNRVAFKRTVDVSRHHETDDRGWAERVRRFVLRFTSASTGSPSDGLDKIEGSESSASVTRFLASQRAHDFTNEEDDWTVDEVVLKGDQHGLAAAAWRATGGTGTAGGTQTATETAGIASSSGSMRQGSIQSIGLTRRGGSQSGSAVGSVWHVVRWRIFPAIEQFFIPRFESAERENEYAKQTWFNKKRMTAFFSLYLLLNWVLYLAQNHSSSPYEMWTYYGPFTLFTVPLPLFVLFDVPRRAPVFFQIWFGIATWYCGWTETIQIRVCGYYRTFGVADAQLCNGKDFLAMLYYSTAVPALALFTVADRLAILVAVCIEGIFLVVFVLVDQKAFARNFVNYCVFWSFILWLHYTKDLQMRHQHVMNSSLKHAYRRQQQLQIAESHAQNSKKRLTSYIFHEVRVPLNTAMLAFQNLQAEQAFREDRLDSNATEIHALEGSLAMMQQDESGLLHCMSRSDNDLLLNDVLDLQRLDAGRFEASYAPFPLHRAINSILGAVRVATTAKRLRFECELDPRIDGLVARLPQYKERGISELYVVFDELRLRQAISNLCSNAVKFTASGTIRVRTLLLAPAPPVDENAGTGDFAPDAIVLRFEIHDNGPGIRPADLASARLFQPFAQTVASRLSSSKGSGLGLAIVKSIISNAGGRLGVQSKKGEGACFWCEIGLRIATAEEIEAERENGMSPLPTPPALPLGGGLGSGGQIHIVNDLAKEILAAATHSTLRPPSAQLESRLSDGGLSVMSSAATVSSPVTTPDSIDSSRPLLATHNTAPAATVAHRLTPPPPTVTSSPSSPNHHPPLSVLVVDDDPLTRTLMTRMLTRLGCQVETAEDGQQFLDKTLGSEDGSTPARYFDACTLDNSMPVMSGEQAIRRFREAGRRDLVVGCTGNALRDDQQQYIDAGASKVLTKPVMQKDLKAMLAEAENRRERAKSAVSSPELPSPEPSSKEPLPIPALSPIIGSPSVPSPPTLPS